MATPRRLQVDPEATRYYHCISRCVRRAFLCGEDVVSGKSFDHRRQWLVDRMKDIAAVFAIDLCAYAVLSNHFHIVVRIDPDHARRWSDDEVVARVRRVFRRSAEELEELPEETRAERIALWRDRLWDLSWFMRCLNEWIARRANREDGCTGRFWEGRFRSQALLDEGAVLTCMSYVDLNPIRAGMATTLEDSKLTSIRERLLGSRSAAGTGDEPAPDVLSGLVPFEGEGEGLRLRRDDQAAGAADLLPMKFGEYVALLEWAGRSIREKLSEATPAHVGVALRQAGLEPDAFVSEVREYRRNFFGMVGQVHRIEVESRRRGHHRRPGIRAARRLYRPAA